MIKKRLFEVESLAIEFANEVNGSVKLVTLPAYNYVETYYSVTWEETK